MDEKTEALVPIATSALNQVGRDNKYLFISTLVAILALFSVSVYFIHSYFYSSYQYPDQVIENTNNNNNNNNNTNNLTE